MDKEQDLGIRGVGMSCEGSTDMYTLLCVKQITSGNCCMAQGGSGTGGSARCSATS